MIERPNASGLKSLESSNNREAGMSGIAMKEPFFDALTEQIISCAFEVHKVLGSGFLERVYENALVEELISRGLKAESQKPITVFYKGRIVGEYCADVMVEDSVILELKALEKVNDIHELQLKNYLKATGVQLGLLINFGKSVEIKRKYVNSVI